MIDLKLTDSGDIDMTEDISDNPKCHISFYIAKYTPQRISFTCIPDNINSKTEKHDFQISFQTKDLDIYTDKSSIVQDIDESMQNLKIRLKTELGDVVYNQSLGSELWKTRHGVYYGQNEASILERIRSIVEEELVKCVDQKYLDNIDIDVSYSTGTGHFACQTVKIDIDIYGYKKISFTL